MNRVHGCAALLALLVTTTLAPVARAEEAPRPPAAQAPTGPRQRPQYTPPAVSDTRRPHEAIIVPAVVGGVLLIGGYALSLVAHAQATQTDRVCIPGAAPTGAGLCYATEDRRGSAWSFVPIVGPFVAAGEGITPGLSIVSGLSQVAGALTLAVGLPLGIDAVRSHDAHVQLSWTGSTLTLSGRF